MRCLKLLADTNRHHWLRKQWHDTLVGTCIIISAVIEDRTSQGTIIVHEFNLGDSGAVFRNGPVTEYGTGLIVQVVGET